MRKRHFIIVFLFCVLFAFTSVQDATAEPSELRFDNTYSGPYADKVLYEIITNENNRVQALLDDQIDILSGPIGNSYISTLDAASDIELSPILRNGYGHLTINCRDAPLNWTTLRKAFAFAYDKIKVQTDIFQGYSQLVDSLVPYANNLFSIEEDLEYHYYSSEVTIGNNLLDAAGFDIDPITGYRFDPNGNPIHIEITYSASSPTIAGGCAQIGADALQSLHIDAAINAADFNTFISTMNNHGAYDMIVYATNFYDFDVEWLANEYWSGNADQPFMNPTNFANETYDSLRDQLINGTTYQEVYNASSEMQKILHYNVPLLVVYEDFHYSAYRTDHFEGYVVDKFKNIGNEWTNLKAHLNLLEGGPFSGTLRVSMAQEPDSFNPMTSNSKYSKTIFDNIFNSLLRTGPDGQKRLDLAESYTDETHDSNPEVPVGHTRFTFNIIQNASWSDGTPLTANDIAYSFTYYKESMVYGNPWGVGLEDMVGAYAPLPSMFVIEFSSESYWLLSQISDLIILQKTLLQSIGLSGWNSWNPVFSSDPYPTSGPFNVTNYSAGDSLELSYNPNYHYGIRGKGSDIPEVSSPDDILIVQGNSEHTISWSVTDDNPLVYRIFQNDSIIVAEYYSSSIIDLELDAYVLAYGTYNFTLEVKDWEYHTVTDTVIVESVRDTFAPEITGPDDFQILDVVSSETIITWIVYEHNPANYTFFRDGENIGGGTWLSGSGRIQPPIHPIPCFVGALTEGVYNFTIWFQDAYGNNSTDTVFVTIESDTLIPELVGPEDIEMMVGDLGVNILWNASDLYPDSFEIYIGDTLSTSGSWDSDIPIIFNLDGFEVGEYNITIYVVDLSGNTASDTVVVKVVTPLLLPAEMILLGIGGIAVVVIVGVFIKFRK